jgi:protein involved in polysaccharide export with SLBB domain
VERLSRQATARNQAQQALLPPEPLTEFQKFVASTTGQILPIYGASLFRHVPSTFAPLDMTPVPSDFVIGPGDELRIRAWGQVNFQANVRVDRSGEIFLPQIGPVHVAGMPFSALDAHLRSAIGRVYRNFDLTVDIGQIRAIQVYVSGEARRPGVYTVSSLSTLVDALFASGGPSVEGSMRHIELRRGSELVTDFDLYDLLIHGDKSKDVKLLPGDVIFIPPVGPQAAVTGSVRNPAIYELRANESLSDLLADAGGVSAVAAEARVSIERIEDHRDRRAMEVAYDASGMATPLADGDLVSVYSIVPLYRKSVILRGNTANPGRFAWHTGMRISDLIPDKDSLITRNYWWKRAQLGLPAPEFEPAQGFARMRQPAEDHPITIEPSPQQGVNSSSQFGLRQDQSGYPQDQSGYPQDQSGYPQNQSGYPQNQSGYPQNQSGDSQNQPGYSQNQNLSAQQRAGSASLAAAQTSSTTRYLPPAQRTEIRLLAPEIDWNYAVIERMDPDTLKTTLIPFDLGKVVLQHDASQDLELQPGDVVSIFSDADIRVPIAQQTKMVTLDGEFVHAGVYTVQPGETLQHLVERAGGLTPNEYLYGSEFTRESTRVVQQARIDEYVQSVGMGIQRSNLAMAASSASSAQDLASGAAAQSSERDILASLRLIRATGRIVLRFAPDSSGTNSIPDVRLEDGDRFVVPPVPATVNVVGSVYDQNSFLYARARRAGTYLQLAGGPNRDADWKHEFIIRADGEVVSRDRSKTIWEGGKFSDLRMYPGDTIVVPEKTFKPSALRGVLDWSQMFSQFALGAAALTVIQ